MFEDIILSTKVYIKVRRYISGRYDTPIRARHQDTYQDRVRRRGACGYGERDHRQWVRLKGALRISGLSLTSVFVALDGGGVAFKLDDFSDELIPSDFDGLVHLGTAHVVGHDEGTRDLVNTSVLGLLIFEWINHVYSVCLFYLCEWTSLGGRFIFCEKYYYD